MWTSCDIYGRTGSLTWPRALTHHGVSGNIRHYYSPSCKNIPPKIFRPKIFQFLREVKNPCTRLAMKSVRAIHCYLCCCYHLYLSISRAVWFLFSFFFWISALTTTCFFLNVITNVTSLFLQKHHHPEEKPDPCCYAVAQMAKSQWAQLVEIIIGGKASCPQACLYSGITSMTFCC